MGNCYQGNAAPGPNGSTSTAASGPVGRAGLPGTSESASTSSRGTKRLHNEQPPNDWSDDEDEVDPHLSESERRDLLSDSSDSESEDEEPQPKKDQVCTK